MAPALELFRGDAHGEKPHYWLKKLQGTMSFDTKEADKLYRFEMGLAPGTVADKWWGKLTAVEKTSWTELMKAFTKKWPAPVEAEESPEELKTRIKSTILKSEDLEKIVGPAGDEMYAHLRWVTDMRPLVEALNDPSMLLRSDVRATLPLEIRSLLPTTGLDSWEKFFAAVETVDSERVQDELERSARHRTHGLPDVNREITGFDPERSGAELMAHVTALMAAFPDYAPRDWSQPALRTTYPRTTTGTPTPQQRIPAMQYQTLPRQNLAPPYGPATPQRAPPPHMPQMQQTPSNWQGANPFMAAPGQLSNASATTFMQRLMQMPGSPSAGRGGRSSLGGDPTKDLALAKCAVANPRTYPTTTAGILQFQTDITAWDAKHAGPNAPAPDYAAYPLTPGTMPAGSKECWTCGLITNPAHFGIAKCRATGATQVPILESNIRALIGNALYPPGARTPGRFQSGVLQIDTDEMGGYNALGMYDVHQILFEDQEEPDSGNAEGHA
ncbi:hypothetical protein K438DRAFT_1980298 [Mycena galopus ATCC 62051]|nr:hypothetical protein K438DRAFT_1980298 [Mycena galopus ATCC 62051]